MLDLILECILVYPSIVYPDVVLCLNSLSIVIGLYIIVHEEVLVYRTFYHRCVQPPAGNYITAIWSDDTTVKH